MRKTLLFILLLLGLHSACRFNPNYQGSGTELIQGDWTEEPIPFQDSLLQYTRHDFRISCDSFYVSLSTKAKTNPYPDSCFNGGKWAEYAKGTYRQSNDTLYFNGTFTKANWKQKLSGCYRIGQYIEAMVIQKNVADTVYLKSLTQHVRLKLVLKKKTVCEPKPLN